MALDDIAGLTQEEIARRPLTMGPVNIHHGAGETMFGSDGKGAPAGAGDTSHSQRNSNDNRSGLLDGLGGSRNKNKKLKPSHSKTHADWKKAQKKASGSFLQRAATKVKSVVPFHSHIWGPNTADLGKALKKIEGVAPVGKGAEALKAAEKATAAKIAESGVLKNKTVIEGMARIKAKEAAKALTAAATTVECANKTAKGVHAVEKAGLAMRVAKTVAKGGLKLGTKATARVGTVAGAIFGVGVGGAAIYAAGVGLAEYLARDREEQGDHFGAKWERRAGYLGPLGLPIDCYLFGRDIYRSVTGANAIAENKEQNLQDKPTNVVENTVNRVVGGVYNATASAGSAVYNYVASKMTETSSTQVAAHEADMPMQQASRIPSQTPSSKVVDASERFKNHGIPSADGKNALSSRTPDQNQGFARAA
ncbi:MAG: hypothetical protein ACOY3I_08020 [Verrucomicrobiota bacterium]